MNKKEIIKHMITTILIVIISFFIWNNNPCQAGAQIAATYNNRNIQIVFDGFDLLTNTPDEKYKELDPTLLSMRNTTNQRKDYKLYYTIAKKSTVPFNTLKLALDDTVIDLSKIDYIEDDTYYYLLVKESSIDAYSNEYINVRIWTSSTSGKLNSSFITR